MEITYNINLLIHNENNEYCDKVLYKQNDDIIFLSGIEEIDRLNFELFNLIDSDMKNNGQTTRIMGYHGIGNFTLKYKCEIGNYSDELISVIRYRGCTIYLIKRIFNHEYLQYLAFISDKVMNSASSFGTYNITFSEIIRNFVIATGDDENLIINNFGFACESDPVLK